MVLFELQTLAEDQLVTHSISDGSNQFLIKDTFLKIIRFFCSTIDHCNHKL